MFQLGVIVECELKEIVTPKYRKVIEQKLNFITFREFWQNVFKRLHYPIDVFFADSFGDKMSSKKKMKMSNEDDAKVSRLIKTVAVKRF